MPTEPEGSQPYLVPRAPKPHELRASGWLNMMIDTDRLENVFGVKYDTQEFSEAVTAFAATAMARIIYNTLFAMMERDEPAEAIKDRIERYTTQVGLSAAALARKSYSEHQEAMNQGADGEPVIPPVRDIFRNPPFGSSN